LPGQTLKKPLNPKEKNAAYTAAAIKPLRGLNGLRRTDMEIKTLTERRRRFKRFNLVEV
jgi:hypothetical protein